MNSKHGQQTAGEQAVEECAAAIEASETWADATADPSERFRFLAERIQECTDDLEKCEETIRECRTQIDASVRELAVIAQEWLSKCPGFAQDGREGRTETQESTE